MTIRMNSRLKIVLLALLGMVGLCGGGARGAEGLRISWTNNLLTVSGPNVPGKNLEIWYLEAFCRKGARQQDWNKTTIAHTTTLLEGDVDGKRLKLRTKVS